MAKEQRIGRPSDFTPEVRSKMEEAAALDASVRETCFYAGISVQSYYNWKEQDPEFFERLDALRQKPILKARLTIVNALNNPREAKWYLEKKRKKEFVTAIDLTTDGASLNEATDEARARAKAFDEWYKQQLSK